MWSFAWWVKARRLLTVASVALMGLVMGCGSSDESDDDASAGSGDGGAGSGGTAGVSTAGKGGTTAGGAGMPGTGGSAGSTAGRASTAGGGGSTGAAAGMGGMVATGACGNAAPAETGWVEIWADVSDLGQGGMTSPIQRCESANGHFAVLAKGTEQDGGDATIMRIQIDGYTGPGSYAGGLADGVEVDVYHSDVGGFTTKDAATCDVCVGADGLSGTFTCSMLPAWSGTSSSTMTVSSGAFACPLTNAEPIPDGGTCTPWRCVDARDELCVDVDPKCASGYCVSEPLKGAYCTGACTNGDACPDGTKCADSTYFPQKVCTGAGECGDGKVDLGELCDEPPPTDHCATSACVTCRPTDKRPGWIDVEADVDGMPLSIDDFVGQTQPNCFRSGSVDSVYGLTASLESCDPEHDFTLIFRAPPTIGTFMYDGTSDGLKDLCVYMPHATDYDHDRLVYCAFEGELTGDGTPEPEESATVTVDELTCDGLGERGHVEGHLVYQRTITATPEAEVIDPAHAGEAIDVSADFDIVGWAQF